MESNVTLTKLLKRVQRHTSFVAPLDEPVCYIDAEIEPEHKMHCKYVRDTENCLNVVRFINYLEFMVCTLKIDKSAFGIMSMILVTLAFIFVYVLIIWVVGKHFLVSNVIVMAKRFHMLKYDFGVIVLAPFIALPFMTDILMDCDYSNTILFTRIMGKTVACFCVGLVLISLKCRTVVPKSIVYVDMPLIVFGVLYNFEVLDFKAQVDNLEEEERHFFNVRICAIVSLVIYFGFVSFIAILHTSGNKDSQAALAGIPSDNLGSDEYITVENELQDVDIWSLVLTSITPFKNPKFESYSKLFLLCIAPIWFVASFFIPVIDHNRLLNGWCKFLTISSFLTFPWLFYHMSGPKFFYSILYLCIMIAVLVGVLTHVRRIPVNHDVFGAFGILSGFLILFIIDNELTVLSWQILHYMGNWKSDTALLVSAPISESTVEMIFCWTLIDVGLVEMAYGVVFGVTTLYTYFVLPVLQFHFCFDGDERLPLTANTQTAYVFLLILYSQTCLHLLFANYELRKSLAANLLAIYGIFFVYMFLSAIEIIHPFGTTHVMTADSNTEMESWKDWLPITTS